METRSRSDAPPPPASCDAPPETQPLPSAETLAEPPRRRGSGSVKRKASSNLSSTPPKRLIKERNALNIPSLHNGPCTRARQSPSKLAGGTGRTATAVATSAGAGPADGGPIVVEEEEETVAADEPIVDPEFDLVRSRGSDAHVIPTPAGWFSWKEIHPLEKHTLASFFNGKCENRTPEIYMEIRNSIMGKFHSNPQTQLELRDLEEIPLGDSDMKQEVMEFLDHWGLINFHPFPSETPEANKADAGEEKQKSIVEKLYQFETVQPCPRFVTKKIEVALPAATTGFLAESSIVEELVGPVGPSVEYHCNSCSGDCSRKRYHCQKQADFDLCTDCYNNEKFGSDMAPSDFILMEPAEVRGMSGGSWTDQETLLLLEALELFGENWNEIAEHVATKTKAQCILHFLQMPIEDPFLDGGDDADDKIQEHVDPGSAHKETIESEVPETMGTKNADGNGQPGSSPTDVVKIKDANEPNISGDGANIAIDALKDAFEAVGYMLEQGRLPSFAEAGNPVMALAVFLTHLVEPDAAAISFRSSLKAMSEDSPGIQLATRHCFLLEDPPNDNKDLLGIESAVGNGDLVEKEDQTQVSNGNDESRDCMDKNKENVISVKNELSPSMESDMNLSENKATDMEIDKNLPIENEKMVEENENSVPKENEKKNMEKDKSSLIENENTSVENSMHQSLKKEKDPSAEIEENPSLENGKSSPKGNKENPSVSRQGCLEKPSAGKEPSNSVLPSEASRDSIEHSGNPTLQGEQIGPSCVKDGSESSTCLVLTSINPENPTLPREEVGPSDAKDDVKDVGDSASQMVLSSIDLKDSCGSALQKEAMISAAKEVNDLKSTGEDRPDSVKDSGNGASMDLVGQVSDPPMAVDPNVPSEHQASNQKVGTISTVESTPEADGCDRKVLPGNDGKDDNSKRTNDDHINPKVNKLKRAAVTALSAAAVKAKLLANQEEDQIRQLASLIIEKQLHKLEAKLALFTDIESVIMRMKEQTERARHRLMHERAQIIAARLGLPGPPRGGNPLSLPTNRLATGPPSSGTTGSNPASISSEKVPPMRRP